MTKRNGRFARLHVLNRAYDCFWYDNLISHGNNADCNTDDGIVRIDSSWRGKPEAAEFLIHEALHVCSDLMELGLEERHIRPLGAGLAQFMAPFLKKVT